jgi:Protein of unknown function (DUF1553)/Protein of unknown function (DUF1549)/Concanavalin A-like lectin/glucanases superfamily/Planctomycete cytochrome C
MKSIALVVALSASVSAAPIDFNGDIRPILSERCYTCHGPDVAARKSNLRLDTEAGAKAAIRPGDPSQSELIRRVTAADSRRMPPAWAGKPPLSAREIDLLTRWIADGARWQQHWSFIPPKRFDPPPTGNKDWSKNAIDGFVLARLEREGLQPSSPADRRTLLRRVTLDLTGLPPTPDEISAFLTDSSPDAYEKVVARLLASPRYGERMAERWLDNARYADSNGYQTDGERSMWRWRDWVIDAYNRNKPYDQFTVEQIAGDLLPNARVDQIVATGFNRNHRGNGEGGIIPEEYAVEYVVDRVETTSAVFLGVTLGCARCHDHKYDPFTQKEFYRMFAFFNNVPERGQAFKYGNSPPVIPAPTAEQQARLVALDQRISAADAAFAKMQFKATAPADTADWSPVRYRSVHTPLSSDLKGDLRPNPPHSARYEDLMVNNPVLDVKTSIVKQPAWQDGVGSFSRHAAEFDGKRYVEVGDLAGFGFFDSFTVSAWIDPKTPDGAIVTRAFDDAQGQGWALVLKNGHLQASLIQRWLDDGARVETDAMIPLNRWSHVALSYDGSRTADGIRIYLDGNPLRLKAQLDDLNQNFDTKQPLRIGGGLGSRFNGMIAKVDIYGTALAEEDVRLLAVQEDAGRIAAIPEQERTPAQQEKLRRAFLETYGPANLREAYARVMDLRDERARMVASFPTVMVMQENPVPRDTHVLLRGAYDHPGDKVSAGVPAVLPPLPAGAPANRLGLAKWLVDPSNPLTARVAVNRYWQMLFGVGLVKTVEDFGSQGDPPSNPELLDWLATEYVRNGWDTKALLTTIVTSATYQQSSRVTPELLARDPENRLLARGPRVRLSADEIRDQSLAVSGLLVEKIGGPSVKPYQPPGLWKELAGGKDYEPDKGDGLHRRSLYTFWKRTAPPPMMVNFDAANRETCVVRELRTNTPLQSLDLMNDPIYLEAARALAGRMQREAGPDPADRISHGFKLVLARPPKPRESEILLSSFHYYLDRYQGDPAAAARYSGGLPAAAYAAVASMILNLDEAVTKE